MSRFVRSRSTYLLLTLLLIVMAAIMAMPVVALSDIGLAPAARPAADTPPAEEIRLESQYQTLRGTADTTFEWDVSLIYKGAEKRNFDLQAKGPQGFTVAIRPGFEATKEIASMVLDPAKTYPDSVKISMTPSFYKVPDPGDYTVTFSAGAGNLKSSIDLKAVITAKRALKVETATGRLNMNANAGGEDHLTFVVYNTGTVPLEKVDFSSDKPGDWSITFNPSEIDSIPTGGSREIDVTVKPPSKTIAGDYMVTLRTNTKDYAASGNLEIRVTVLTPTIWGWVGVGIVVLVIAGLAVIFWRLGRR